jgi:hypothetical protein
MLGERHSVESGFLSDPGELGDLAGVDGRLRGLGIVERKLDGEAHALDTSIESRIV